MLQPQLIHIRNHLLNVMTRDDFDRLAPDLEPVSRSRRALVIVPYRPVTHAYFVEDGVISLISDTREGRIEIGLVGREGFAGVSLVLAGETTPHAALVQADLTALRIPALALRNAMNVSPSLRDVLGCYVQSLIVQVGQTVHANADLTIEKRLARWILMMHDRLERKELPLTHEFLAIMLGVHRPGVTTALQALESLGVIQGRRSRVIVLDREKLVDMVGDTYGLAEAEYLRLIPNASASRTKAN